MLALDNNGRTAAINLVVGLFTPSLRKITAANICGIFQMKLKASSNHDIVFQQ